MYKLAKGVLVSHNNISTEITLYHDGKFNNRELSSNTNKLQHHTNQHLHIISLDTEEKIEEGDYYYNGSHVFKCDSLETVNSKRYPYLKKVIASTDKSLGKPQPSPKYIQQFIEEYNKGEVKDIKVEYEEDFGYNLETIPKGDFCNDDLDVVKTLEPKLTNNFVTIRPVEPVMYTEGGLATIAIEFGEYLDTQRRNLKSMDNWFYDWFELNKKK